LGPANETLVHLRRGAISGASSKHKHLEIRFQPPDEAEQLHYFTTASLLRVDLLKAAKRIFFYSTGNVLRLKTTLARNALKLIHTTKPDTTKLSCRCRVRFCGVNWIPDNSRLSPTERKFEV